MFHTKNNKKRFTIIYESNATESFAVHRYGGLYATLSECKIAISNIRIREGKNKPRNFKVFDLEADINPHTGFAPEAYKET